MKIKHFDPAMFDFGKKKAFPMRPGHFFTSCEKAMSELDWTPEYPSVEGLRDSYENDFVHKKVLDERMVAWMDRRDERPFCFPPPRHGLVLHRNPRSDVGSVP